MQATPHPDARGLALARQVLVAAEMFRLEPGGPDGADRQLVAGSRERALYRHLKATNQTAIFADGWVFGLGSFPGELTVTRIITRVVFKHGKIS